LRKHRAGSRLPPAQPPAQLLSRPNPLPDAVRSGNPSKSTLAHDAVAAAVSHKHHSIIRVGAGLILFVYGSHSRLATGVTSSKILFWPFCRVNSKNLLGTAFVAGHTTGSPGRERGLCMGKGASGGG